MKNKRKLPKNQGRPIRVGRAKSEQARWMKNPKNKGLTDTFPVSVEQIQKHIQLEGCSGIEFCNGISKTKEYSPVMAAVNEDGQLIAAFNNEGPISKEEYEFCRSNWERDFPKNEFTQFFFLGEESLRDNIEDFDVARYVAAFVEKEDGTDSAVLYGYSYNGLKGPEEEEPDTSLNRPILCPPWCDEDE